MEQTDSWETTGVITLQEWQPWGTDTQIPAVVDDVVSGLKRLGTHDDGALRFSSLGQNFQGLHGERDIQIDKKYQRIYMSLNDAERKLQFFVARQIACRLVGSRGYLCQKCWLAREDCMCSKLVTSFLWPGIHFWLYMHPKDFLRQNNTGKLLWQVFGIQSATLCLFGVHEHEDLMWNAFRRAGKDMVWCLYPKQNAHNITGQDVSFHGLRGDLNDDSTLVRENATMHFILIDGTWNNSASLLKRLQKLNTGEATTEHGIYLLLPVLNQGHAMSLWGMSDLPCLSLSLSSMSVMHKLRLQPSWDRTCTAAAAGCLLSELHLLPEFSCHGLDIQAEAVQNAVYVLLNALTIRRVRMGRSIIRRERGVLESRKDQASAHNQIDDRKCLQTF